MSATGPARFDAPPPGRRPPANLRAIAMRRKELEAELEQARQAVRQSRRAANKQWFLEPLTGEREDGWLITYLDMMTLLLVLMLVMLAFAGKGIFSTDTPTDATGIALVQRGLSSQYSTDSEGAARSLVDEAPPISTDPDVAGASADHLRLPTLIESESAAVSPQLPAAIDALPIATDKAPKDILLSAISGMAVELDHWFSDIKVPDPLDYFSTSPSHGAGVQPELKIASASPEVSSAEPVPATTPNLEETARRLLDGLPLDQLGDDIDVIISEKSISFRINSEILFSSGKADLSRAGLAVLQRLVPVLRKLEHQITVEGHTDAVPIRSSRYPSNWELSGSRAGSVVRYLESNGVPSSRLRAVGYADTRPLGDNQNADGRALNRRVELIVERREESDLSGPLQGEIELSAVEHVSERISAELTAPEPAMGSST